MCESVSLFTLVCGTFSAYALCRSDFLGLISGQPQSAMLLQESSEVTIRMDEQDTLVQLQLLRMKLGQETVGLKLSAKSH